MPKKSTNKELVEKKKEKFYETVFKICLKRNLPMPHINFRACPETTSDQLAHYHHGINMICVSEFQLHRQNFDDIEKTAAHEVSHIKVRGHGAGFTQEQELSQIAGWSPPAGTVVLDSKDKFVRKKSRKYKPDKTRCNYHLCRKKRKLEQCKHCKMHFCTEHTTAYVPDLDPTSRKKGHPCASYLDFLLIEEEKEKKKYQKALKSLLKSKTYGGTEPVEWYTVIQEPNKSLPKKKVKGRGGQTILIVRVKRYFLFPGKDVVVTLSKDGQFLAKRMTNKEGFVVFKNLENDLYSVEVDISILSMTKHISLIDDWNMVKFNFWV